MEIQDVQKVLAGLSPEETVILMAPDALEELKVKGFPLEVTPPTTLDEYFEKKKREASMLFRQLPPPPDQLPPDIKSLYTEILECMSMGLFGPAITMCAIMVEFALKRACWLVEAGGYQMASPESWVKYEDMDLGNAINCSKARRLISKKQGEALEDFRTRIRNPYLHYNIQGITADVIAQGVKRLDMATGAVDVLDIPAAESIPIQTQAKPFMDSHFIIAVFNMADGLVKHLDIKTKEVLASTNPASGLKQPHTG